MRLGIVAAVAWLLSSPQDDSDTILRMLRSANPQVRREGIWKAGSCTIEVGEKLIPEIVRLLKNPDPDLRLSAIAAIEEMWATEAAPDLIPLVDDKEEGVRI